MSDSLSEELQAFAADDASRRRHRRWFVDFQTTVTLGGEPLACQVYDLSPGGACVELRQEATVFPGHRLTFELPGFGSIPAQVQYNTDGVLGLMFLHAADGENEVARYLVEVEQNRRPERHDVKLDITLRASGVELACVLEEISRLGARVLLDETRHLLTGQEVTLQIPGFGSIAASVQRVEDRALGLAFLEELDLVTGALPGGGG